MTLSEPPVSSCRFEWLFLGSQYNECQRLNHGKTKHVHVHDVPGQIPWFCRLPPYLKVWRFLEDSLPFRCRYRLELTLVFGARDLNSVIQQTVRSEIWFSEDCELQSIERVAFAFIWKESLKEFSDELKYGIVLQRTISDTTRWIVFLFGLCSTLLIHTMNNPPGAEIMTSECCPGKPKIHESEISLIILMF